MAAIEPLFASKFVITFRYVGTRDFHSDVPLQCDHFGHHSDGERIAKAELMSVKRRTYMSSKDLFSISYMRRVGSPYSYGLLDFGVA